MPETELPWLRQKDRVLPLPEEASSDPRIDVWASEQEESEHLSASLSRGLADRGTDAYQIQLVARRIAVHSSSDKELLANLRRQLFFSHLIGSAKDAELFITSAVDQYRRRRGIDPDLALLIAAGLQREYKDREQLRRRKRVAAIAREIERDPKRQRRLAWQEQLRQEHLAWHKQVNEFAREFGLDYAFVDEFMREYAAQSRPRHPGVIDPRGVPAIGVLGAQRHAIAAGVKSLIWGIGLYEGITGKDILSGRELEAWERVLLISVDVLTIPGARVPGPVRGVVR